MEDKNKNIPEPDPQWLQELFAESEADAAPEAAAEKTAVDEAWLDELFAEAEKAVEQEIASEIPTQIPDLPAPAPAAAPAEVTPWPEELTEAVPEAEEIGPDEHLVAAAGLIHPEDMELEKILQEAAALEEMPEAAPEAEPEPVPAEPAAEASSQPRQEDDAPKKQNKRRPRNKGSYGLFGLPHLLVTGIWLAIILTFGVFLGQWLWKGASDVLAFGRENKMVTIKITEQDDLDSLTEKLHSAGLIKEPMWFKWYGQLTDVIEDIDPGTFELSTLFDYHALVAHMTRYSTAHVTANVVIPEGYTCAQIFQLLEENDICSAAAMEDACINAQLSDYWFLAGVQRDDKYCLEGYLFPDTYTFYKGDSAERVLITLLNNFKVRFSEEMKESLTILNDTLAAKMRANGLSEEYIAAHAVTVREVVIIASLIEKESAGPKESSTIASVIYNRLTNPEKYPYLNIDAALVYVTGHAELTEEDKSLESPYNTYITPGLIPGPIANPSLASLKAALNPQTTGYYFYAYDPATGAHHFSATYAEHQAFLNSLPKEEPETP